MYKKPNMSLIVRSVFKYFLSGNLIFFFFVGWKSYLLNDYNFHQNRDQYWWKRNRDDKNYCSSFSDDKFEFTFF